MVEVVVVAVAAVFVVIAGPVSFMAVACCCLRKHCCFSYCFACFGIVSVLAAGGSRHFCSVWLVPTYKRKKRCGSLWGYGLHLGFCVLSLFLVFV